MDKKQLRGQIFEIHKYRFVIRKAHDMLYIELCINKSGVNNSIYKS